MNPNVIICDRCQTENPSYSKYCRGCGYELPKPAIENNAVTQTPVKSAKKVGLGLTIGLIVAGLFIGIILGILIGAAGTAFYLNEFPQLANTNKALVDMNNNINRNLPMMIDSETRLDQVMVTDNKTFQYTYTLVNMESGKVDTTAMKNNMEPNIINSVKTAPEMELQRTQKRTFVFYYKDKIGNYLFSIVVTPDKYK